MALARRLRSFDENESKKAKAYAIVEHCVGNKKWLLSSVTRRHCNQHSRQRHQHRGHLRHSAERDVSGEQRDYGSERGLCNGYRMNRLVGQQEAPCCEQVHKWAEI